MSVSVRSRLEAVPTPGLALAALVLLNLMWGGSLPATKLALLSFGPFSLAAARLLLASALFVGVLRPGAIRQVPLADALRMAGLGVIGFAGVQVLQALGTGQTSGATATVLASTGPLFIALLAPALLRERLGAATLVGLVLALAGVSVIMGLGVGQPEDLAGGLTGNLIVLLSSAAAAVYTVLGKGLAQRYSPLTFCTVSCLGGALASLPLAAWELSTAPIWYARGLSVERGPTPLGWALLVYLGVLVTFFGFGVWFWGLRALPARGQRADVPAAAVRSGAGQPRPGRSLHPELPARLRPRARRYLPGGQTNDPSRTRSVKRLTDFRATRC